MIVKALCKRPLNIPLKDTFEKKPLLITEDYILKKKAADQISTIPALQNKSRMCNF